MLDRMGPSKKKDLVFPTILEFDALRGIWAPARLLLSCARIAGRCSLLGGAGIAGRRCLFGGAGVTRCCSLLRCAWVARRSRFLSSAGVARIDSLGLTRPAGRSGGRNVDSGDCERQSDGRSEKGFRDLAHCRCSPLVSGIDGRNQTFASARSKVTGQ